eukprot:SAG11_NODE_10473_length_829_cov_0.961644_1_plen_32_part_10
MPVYMLKQILAVLNLSNSLGDLQVRQDEFSLV